MTANDDNAVEITRHLKAPPALVFDAFSTAAHLEKWFAPDGFECRCEVDFRVGGAMVLRLIGFGMDHAVRGTYREIVRPQRIVYAQAFDDLPRHQFVTRLTFAEHALGTTTLTMRQEFPPWSALTDAEAALLKPRLAGAPIGWGQTLDHLAQYVGSR